VVFVAGALKHVLWVIASASSAAFAIRAYFLDITEGTYTNVYVSNYAFGCTNFLFSFISLVAEFTHSSLIDAALE